MRPGARGSILLLLGSQCRVTRSQPGDKPWLRRNGPFLSCRCGWRREMSGGPRSNKFRANGVGQKAVWSRVFLLRDSARQPGTRSQARPSLRALCPGGGTQGDPARGGPAGAACGAPREPSLRPSLKHFYCSLAEAGILPFIGGQALWHFVFVTAFDSPANL